MAVKHTLFKCEQPCEKLHCMFCDGGLASCTICNGAEASLPTDCPGEPISDADQRDIMTGELDYRAGEWRWK